MKKWMRILRDSLYYRVRERESNVHDTPLGKSLSVITYNVRCDAEEDGKHNWEYRKRYVAQVIREERASIVCLQELAPHTLKYLLHELEDYDCRSVDAKNGRSLHRELTGYGLAILFDRKRYIVRNEGHLWLSDTPNKPSRTWGNKEYRIAMFVELYDTYEDKCYHVFNTHFDHTSVEAIGKSSRLLAERVGGMDNVFIAGDFNAEIDTLYALNEALHNNVSDDTPTFVGFRSQKSKVIDTIYTRDPCERKVIIKKYNGYNPSDHHAVRVEVNCL